jgi:glycosyltransferase involved in cell wall biosynthesis
MKVLVAVQSYSLPNKKSSHFFVQVRNLYYKEHGINVEVLNFNTKENYIIDGISVYNYKSAIEKIKNKEYDILISHQPNLRNHLFLFLSYSKYFKKKINVFHGHEVLNIRKVYAKPYSYERSNSQYNIILQEIYDRIKLFIWNKIYKNDTIKTHYLFVSKWMYDEFLKWTKIKKCIINNSSSITYNCIGKDFENNSYQYETSKEYDFITIRTNIDGSKYCIDLVNKLAIMNPDFKFLVIGKGSYWKYNRKAPNIIWHDILLNHNEIIKFLNNCKCALMPTRTDAQGLMACEMATFGIPVITSDIPVCKEIFEDFDNLAFIDNENIQNIDLKELFVKLRSSLPYKKNEKFFAKNTVEKEVQLIKELSSNKNLFD